MSRLQAQDPVFADDQDAALLQVVRGEFAIGVGLTGRSASQLIKEGQPINSIWPNDFVITVTNGTPLMNKAPHPNAGKVFINWMLTMPGQQLWRDVGQFPIRTDVVPADDWMKGFTQSKTIYENVLTASEQEASLKEATGYFKK